MPVQKSNVLVAAEPQTLKGRLFSTLKTRPTLTFLLLAINFLLLMAIFIFGSLIYTRAPYRAGKIHTLQSTVTKGQEAKIPDYFSKSGIPIYKDAQVVQVTEGETTTTVIAKSKDSFAKVKQYYTNWLEKNDWKKEIIHDQEGSIALSGSKNKTALSVIIVKNDIYTKVATNSPVTKITGEETTINLAINRQ